MVQIDERLKHIAFIMDGNGRWAQKRGKPREYGHRFGVEALERVSRYCQSLGLHTMTVYAFSTENWKRSADEVGGIMRLLGRYLKEAIRDMEKNHVRFRFFGDLSRLDPKLRALCEDAQNRSLEFVNIFRKIH